MPSLPQLLAAAIGTLAALNWVSAKPDHVRQQAPLIDNDYVCEHPPYKVFMVSQSPLIIYIKDFITPSERAHLLRISENTFTRSGVTSSQQTNAQSSHHRRSIRTSQSTTLPPSDPLVRCLESRALSFQGFDTPRAHLEPLQLVRYAPSEHYHFHTDWFPPSPSSSSSSSSSGVAGPEAGGNRASSFFAYVHVANGTTGGGTNFPRVGAPADARWCDEGWVDCDEPWERGLTFRPVEGNAVFWANLLADGTGDERTLHAGLPVVTGAKVGMNIWTREGPVSEEVRGVEA